MNITAAQAYEIWDRFLTQFPLSKLSTMTLEEYSRVGAKDTFCWWIESGLQDLGSIWGSTAFKFGIYERKNTDKEFISQSYRADDRYAWLAKYGETAEEAFSTVRSLVSQIAQAANEGDLEKIEEMEFAPLVKWKIAFHYQDRSAPVIINTFKKEWLVNFIITWTGNQPSSNSLAALNRSVMALRDNQDLLEFGEKVWTEGPFSVAYPELKKQFLKNYPDFSTFTSPSEAYLTEERNYKQELCTIFKEEIAPRLHPLPDNEADRVQLGKHLAELFSRKLVGSGNRPQNLVGWRYTILMKELDNDGLARLADAVSRLTNKEASLDEEIPAFVDFLHAHSAEGNCGHAATRSITSFFLFLSDPKKHVFIKTEEITQLLKRFKLEKFNNASLAPEEYRRVQNLAEELHKLLEKDGLQPQDMIDVQSFIWVALQAEQVQPGAGAEEQDPEEKEHLLVDSPLNQILYGPPGTGKTYRTARLAVQICDGRFPSDRKELMNRYRVLEENQRISFVSFHQSFSYEEFIEGIRPSLVGRVDSEDEDSEQLVYKVENGLFKKICAMAKSSMDDLTRPKLAVDNLSNKRFFKMSVGGRNWPSVESFCFNNDYLALGWGGDLDYSSLTKEKKWEPGRDAIKALMKDKDPELLKKSYAVQAMFIFKNGMDVGDIVIVPKGISQVQAIGQVTGEYEYLPDLIPGNEYVHFRRVRWLIRDTSIPAEKVISKNFMMQSIYSLDPSILKMDYLEKLLAAPDEEESAKVERYVLIIDEINRANISKVLGELITLLEVDKRLGEVNEVTVQLPYSRERFGIPSNLYIIGTMNTADRSLALMDTALRRRFEFVEMMPEYSPLAGLVVGDIQIEPMLRTMNRRIEVLYDREHTIGHAFFLPLRSDPTIELLATIFEHSIIPLLAEYFFEDWQKIRMVLGDNQKLDQPDLQFIKEEELAGNGTVLFGNTTDLSQHGLDQVRRYTRNPEALTDPESYLGIYDQSAIAEE